MATKPRNAGRADEDDEEIGVLLTDELRRRGMSEAEIVAALRKRKRRKSLELNAVRIPRSRLQPTAGARRDELCTVEFAAGQLKLHPKTVLRFIREGRLRATRVGKSYRILRTDLDAFSGLPARPETPAEEAWVTCIVDVPGTPPAMAERWARQTPAALGGRTGGGAPIRAEVIYEPERSHMKVVVVGSPADTLGLMSLIRVWLEQEPR
ncbi:MAG TPA: helix-turn-helix domain-containing protein [Caulobacteraceae bacterium]|nr:helix-turn-helix domain-containing protein [Caulobacteraceae bacterium]